MKFIKTLLSFLLVSTLFSPFSVKASEEDGSKQENIISKDQQKENALNTTIFTEWAMNESEYIFDSFGSIHTMLPTNLISDYTSSITLTLQYTPWPYGSRDPILYWDYYKESQGVLTYDSYSMIFASSTTTSDIKLSQEYLEQEFIYIRMGTLSDYSDTTINGVTFKKIRNPYFRGASSPSNNGTVIVSNESTDPNTSQSTGTFSINQLNEKITMDKSLPQEAYKVDMNPEYDSTKENVPLFAMSKRNALQTYSVGETKNFWVVDNQNYSDYQITAELKYSGQYGEIWVNNDEISSAQSKEMSDEFDQEIYPLITDNFAKVSDVDGNRKVSILVYDIKDGFSGSGGYVGGYFYARDLYQQAYSNRSEIFYIDTYPSMGYSKASYDVNKAFSTITHEFQHMVNFNQNVLIEGGANMDTWLNEALSMAAEHMYLNGALTSRVQYYELSSSIANGHSLLYWDRSGDTLANYSLSYLFGQYLRIQADQGNSIYKELLTSPYNVQTALTSIIQKYMDSDKTLGEFMTDFRQALYVNDETGLHGFNGEPVLSEIDSPEYTGALPRTLRGGGAINVPIESIEDFSVPSNKGASIKYRLISETTIDTTPPANPVVQPVTDQSTEVTGYAETGSTITVKAGQNIIGTGTVPSAQSFSVAIPKQKPNTLLSVIAKDASGNESKAVEIVVSDITPPMKAIVNPVTDQSTSVTGKGEPGATVEVIAGADTMGVDTIQGDGSFSIPINKLVGGTEITVNTWDAAGLSSSVTLIVMDVTAPVRPIVNQVTDQSLSVTGTAEAGSTITVKAVTTVLGTGTANNEGQYNISIVKQAVGTELSITAKDTLGNVSTVAKVTVIKAMAEETNRIAGIDRYETAVSISQEGWVTAQTVVLATGTDFPDALAGGPLAYKENAPILLTRPTKLHDRTAQEIQRLKAKKIIILGSQGAVSKAVEDKLRSMGLAVERIGGENRFATAALIAKRLPSNQAVIAYGFNFPDALSISPYAAKSGIPILLTRSDRVPAETLSAVAGKVKTIVVGSTSVISETVAKKFPQPVRYGGATRYETGKEIITKLSMGTEKAYIATGANFPDALAGSVFAAKNDAPILLVTDKSIPKATSHLISNYDGFTIFGSQGAVGDEVKKLLD